MKMHVVLQVEFDLEAKSIETIERRLEKIVETMEDKGYEVTVEEQDVTSDVLDDFDDEE